MCVPSCVPDIGYLRLNSDEVAGWLSPEARAPEGAGAMGGWNARPLLPTSIAVESTFFRDNTASHERACRRERKGEAV